MSKQAHTPGPWKVSGYHRAVLESKVSKDGCSITIANMPKCAGPGFEKGFNETNAKLIAAAPDLLKACQEALDYIGGYYKICPCKKLRKAIDKATTL